MLQKPRTKHHVPEVSDICKLGATELSALIRQGRLSSREVLAAFLDRIEAVNPALNAIVSPRPREHILREADSADAAIRGGQRGGPMFGLPIAIKDLARTKGIATTYGSRALADFVPEEDELFVARIRAAGAIIIGKTNVPEFGFGSQTYNDVFGATANAFDPDLTAGGSSGGAAAAVSLNLTPVADGSDMGGSLRNPAAYNNIYGFRPSQGLVPSGRQPEAFLSPMSTEGPMARKVADLAMLLDVMTGYDSRTPFSYEGAPDHVTGLTAHLTGSRIAWLGDLGGYLPLESGILELCEAALARLEEQSFRMVPMVPAFDFERLWRAFVVLRQSTGGCGLLTLYDDPATRNLLKPEAVWEIESSLRLTARDIYEASVVRTSWYHLLQDIFERYDFLALPTAQVFPFDIDLHWPGEINGRRMDSYHRWMEVVIGATMAGCPAVNVPVGFDDRGRPMGMQLIGKPRGDLDTLRMAAAYERSCPWTAGAS